MPGRSTRRVARDKLSQAHQHLLEAGERVTIVAYWYRDAHPEITDALAQISDHIQVLADLVEDMGANM